MLAFGPCHPPSLRPVISHAERFCDRLDDWETFAAAKATRGARAWAAGRRSEVELIVTLGLEDVAAGRRTVGQVERGLLAYLGALHAAAESRLGLVPPLGCCCDEEFLTHTVRGDDLTRLGGAGRPRLPSDEDTWMDRAGLVDLPVVSDRARAAPVGRTDGG